MSGFLITDPRAQSFSAGECLTFVPGDRVLACSWSALATTLVRQDRSDEWGPAWSEERKAGLMLWGRPRLEPEAWENAAGLPLQGGLAARVLLDCWLKGGDAALEQVLNGAAVVLLWDGLAGRLHLWTDRAGVMPVYECPGSLFAISSHPDTLADWMLAQGRTPSLDPDSMAELLATGAVSPPYALYKEIRLLSAASHFSWLRSGAGDWFAEAQSVYWQPPAIDQTLTRESAAEGISAALRAACRRQPPGKTVLLLSGGADSRGLLFAHPRPEGLHCVTFCDAENDEVARARDIAAVAGVQHEVWQRDPEHYGLGALATIRATSGMGSIKDAHFAGFHRRLADLGAGSIVTGCYADYLLKGLALNREPYRLFGRELPVERLAAYNPDFYQPAFRLAESANRIVEQRRLAREGIGAAERYARAPRDIETLRVFPLAREADSMGRLYLQATLPWDPIFADRDLLDFYGRLSPALKLNSEAFALAVLGLLPSSARAIPNNNDGQFPLGFSVKRKLFSSSLSLLRRAVVNRFVSSRSDALASWCSWPNFAYYVAHSRALTALWQDHPISGDGLLTDLIGEGLMSRTQAAWAAQPSLYLRLLTLRTWLSLRGY